MTPWIRIIQEIKQEKREGASALARRAADMFRLLADALPAAGDEWRQAVEDIAVALATARPAFAGLARLASAGLDAADRASGPDEAARQINTAVDRFVRALDDDATRIVAGAAHLLQSLSPVEDGRRSSDTRPIHVLTISASSLVERTLLSVSDPARLQVTCLESRPMGEGIDLARRLAEAGLAVTLTLDALGPSLAQHADIVLLGGDTLAPGGLLHKVGTFGLALAAHRARVPVYALVGPEKLLPALLPGALTDGGTLDELLPFVLLADFPPSVRVEVPYFDLTALDLLSGVVMPDGVVSPPDAARLAAAATLHPRLGV